MSGIQQKTVLSEDTYLTLPDGKIYVKKWFLDKTNNVPPVILMHDSLGCVPLWRDFPLHLARVLKRPVIAYDRLGFGLSDARSDLPSLEFIEQEATDYFPLVKAALNISEYVILGHSVGGGMAINIAARDKDCVAVISISTQTHVEQRTIEGIEQAKLMFSNAEQFGRLTRWHGEKAKWVLSAWTETWLNESFKKWHLHTAINRLVCPILAIHGDNDEYGSSAFLEQIVQLSAGRATKRLLKNCGHMPHKEQESIVLREITSFLANA